jgi:hypothetical protein
VTNPLSGLPSPGLPELVEGRFFSFCAGKKGEGFDKLSQAGISGSGISDSGIVGSKLCF